MESPSKNPYAEQPDEKPDFLNPKGEKVPLILSNENGKLIQVPATLNQHLRDYQKDGVRFLFEHYEKNEGALLGDDMGLGKTVQIIAFVSAVLGKTGTVKDLLRHRPKFIREMSGDEENDSSIDYKPFLIIGPASVLYNWVDELETWGYFSVGKFHKGHKNDTIRLLEKGRIDIVVTTFETCRDHVEDLNKFEWSAVIADEVHKIKGLKAEVTLALKKLNCERRFGLTGTLLQNNLTELWCILDWVAPGKLGNLVTFQEKYAKRIEKGQKHDATKRELADARIAVEKLAEVKNKLFLRRTKSHIADQLPRKDEMVVYCKPTEIQTSVYQAILAHDDMKLILKQHDVCPCGSEATRGHCCYRKNKEGLTVKTLTFTFLHLLMKAANHIALLIPKYSKSDLQKKFAQSVCETALAGHPEFVHDAETASFRTLSDPKHCGKMEVLHGLLKVFRKEGCKVLLFSYSVQLLDIIEQHVISMGYEFRRLDGKTQDFKRVQIVREFNKDADIFLFLASTKSGGVGLNLTGANVVIIFDPNWNPTHDLQAQDRAYRLGQNRDVRIFRLILQGTIEENIYLRQIYKQQLDNVAVSEGNARRYFHGIAGDKANKGELFGVENMFKLRTGDSCLTNDILKRNQRIEGGLACSGYKVSKYIPGDSKPDDSDNVQSEDMFGLKHIYETLVNDDESDDCIDIQQFDSEDESFNSRISGNTPKPVQRSRSIDSQGEPIASTSKQNVCENVKRNSPGRKRTKIRPKVNTAVKIKQLKTCERKKVMKTESSDDSSEDVEENNIEAIDWLSEAESEPDESDVSVIKHVARKDETENNLPGQGQGHIISASFSSVGDVLQKCGVLHTHENRKLVGASKAEDHMTRCAIKDVYELHQDTQQPAMYCDPYQESTESEASDIEYKPKSRSTKTKTKKSRSTETDDLDLKVEGARSMLIGGNKVLIGQTPKLLQKKQFRQILEMTKYKSVTELAQAVLECDSKGKEAILKKFYCKQHSVLKEALNKK